ncbi:kinase-like protein [Calocera cornea HHB12733]|uniref:Kinase-like protein n=1 Tax=Calocera cornea HHB12733 TaxID=1353952 RepID=A0A165EB22_9BASI|nr:kinase-like protein [Calocera cornea HHB12733]
MAAIVLDSLPTPALYNWLGSSSPLLTSDITLDITHISSSMVDGGARGDIWTANYHGVKVALKTMRSGSGSSSRRSVQHLFRELNSWARLRHANILELYGVCRHGPYGFAMVSPWMEHGDVKNYLMIHPAANRPLLVSDVVQGLIYLHSLETPIVHGDLRARNVLVTSTGHACLADFGLSRAVVSTQTTSESSGSSSSRGNVRWMSPERLLPERYGLTLVSSFTPAADIWSLGMVIYEIFSGEDPFYRVRNHWHVCQLIQDGGRPWHPGQRARQRGLSDGMWSIAQYCWGHNWRKRPGAGKLAQRLSTLQSNIAQ